MMESPVVELLETEYRRVWDRFYDEFTFRPSTSSFKRLYHQGAHRIGYLEPCRA